MIKKFKKTQKQKSSVFPKKKKINDTKNCFKTVKSNQNHLENVS